MTDESAPRWRTSSRSQANGECVEVAGVTGGTAVRDTKNRPGGTLTITADAWHTFTDAVRTGHFG